MRGMHQIGHDGTYVTEEYLMDLQRAGIRRQINRQNLIMRFGCGGCLGTLASLGTIAVGGMMMLDGHVSGDVGAINNGKIVLEVGVGALAASGTSIGIAVRMGHRP